MKIAIAQTRPIKGDIPANIEKHQTLIELAASFKANALFFPGLSLTGYEPELANALATNQDDRRLDQFQQLSEMHQMTIGLGIPVKTGTGIQIGMIFFQPGQPRQTYSKQQLHQDELPYFERGDRQIILTIDNQKVAPAICYESLQPGHAEYAHQLGAKIYLASVAKSQNGVDKAMTYYPEVAKRYSMPVFMSNCVGQCDDFICVGGSAAWTKEGQLTGQLDAENEGILIYDTVTGDTRLEYGS